MSSRNRKAMNKGLEALLMAFGTALACACVTKFLFNSDLVGISVFCACLLSWNGGMTYGKIEFVELD